MMADHMLRMLLFIATVEWFVVIKGIKDAIKSLLVLTFITVVLSIIIIYNTRRTS
jgi:hypothetical protein